MTTRPPPMFPNRVRELRLARGMTQAELGRLTGTSKQQIGKLELGVLRLAEPWVTRLADAFDVQREELWLPREGDATDRERYLLRVFRNLQPVAQEAVEKVIEAMHGQAGATLPADPQTGNGGGGGTRQRKAKLRGGGYDASNQIADNSLTIE